MKELSRGVCLPVEYNRTACARGPFCPTHSHDTKRPEKAQGVRGPAACRAGYVSFRFYFPFLGSRLLARLPRAKKRNVAIGGYRASQG